MGYRQNILLAIEPWGHITLTGSECHCLSSDRTGAYVHALSMDHYPGVCVSSPSLPPQDVTAGYQGRRPDDSRVLVSAENHSVRPGSVPFVSHRAGAYGQLLLTTYDRMMSGSLSACDWLTPVMRGGSRLAPPVCTGEIDDVS